MRTKRLLLGLAITVALVLAIAVPASAATAFSDVEGHYAASIETLSTWGVVGGYADGTFRPDNTLQRQQFAKMAVLTMGYAVASTDVCTFKDAPQIDTTNPLYPGSYVAVAAKNNTILGYPDNTFGFYGSVTRQQVISVVVRAAGASLTEAPVGWKGIFDYSDATHGQNIKKAEYNGLLAGIEDIYSWDVTNNATRGEAAELLAKLFAKPGNSTEGTSGAITVSGSVDNVVGLTIGRLQNVGVVTLTVEHPKNGPTEYTGVRFSKLFELLGVQSSAVSMNIVASDGYKWTIKVADIKAAADAMLAIGSGKLNLVMPGMTGKNWVKDVVALEFK
jgi:hypothetical protein